MVIAAARTEKPAGCPRRVRISSVAEGMAFEGATMRARLLSHCVVIALAAAASVTAALPKDCNTGSRSVLLLLDASGSMNARLPGGGETRIEVARRAVKDVA